MPYIQRVLVCWWCAFVTVARCLHYDSSFHRQTHTFDYKILHRSHVALVSGWFLFHFSFEQSFSMMCVCVCFPSICVAFTANAYVSSLFRFIRHSAGFWLVAICLCLPHVICWSKYHLFVLPRLSIHTPFHLLPPSSHHCGLFATILMLQDPREIFVVSATVGSYCYAHHFLMNMSDTFVSFFLLHTAHALFFSLHLHFSLGRQ